MKKIKHFLTMIAIAIIMSTTFTSCVTPAEAQVVVDVTPEAIILHGIPYWFDGSISYYFYGGRYWYPYYVDGHPRFIPYRSPLNPRIRQRELDRRIHEMHRPHHNRPHHQGPAHRPSPTPRPHVNQGGHYQPHQGPAMNRPSGSPQSHGTPSRSGGHFGGRR